MSFRAPIGTDDFARLRQEGLVYVDKSRLISDLMDDGALVILLPRPRRFGKTTNLSMLRCFFERSPGGEDRSELFRDLAVWSDSAAMEHFQRYPVISITLKELKPLGWEECLGTLRLLVATLAQEQRWLLETDALDDHDRAQFEALAAGTCSTEQLKRALLDLSRWLARATGAPVVILIDEYDTPIHAGWLNGYYREVVDFLWGFLGAGLKGNPHLIKGVLTGILRVSNESNFSGLNHLAVYTLLRERYSEAFGFTEPEVAALAEQAGASRHLPTIRRWYNGYRFGTTTIYNPWSVLNFLASEDFEPRPYWANTSGNELIGRLITAGQEGLSLELEQVLQGGKLRKLVNEALVLPDLERDADATWSLLLMSGYLKPVAIHKGGEVTLAIPNREIQSVYDTLLGRWMQSSVGGSLEVERMLRAMLSGDVERFEDDLGTLVRQALSYHDTGGKDPERVYHAFTLGMLVQFRASHRVESNPESGLGRADVLVLPRKPGKPGVVLEFKRVREHETPDTALASALEQIEARGYAARLVDAGASPIRRYAIVFDGKRVRVRAA